MTIPYVSTSHDTVLPEGLQRFEAPLPGKGEDVWTACTLDDASLLLVVIDGHGGHACAERAAALWPDAFRAAYEGNNSEPRTALGEAAVTVGDATADLTSGAVYTAVWLDAGRRQLSYAQVGDTVAFWHAPDGSLVRTPDHNVRTNLEERRAACSRGGLYDAGYIVDPSGMFGLQSARVLGDVAMAGIVTSEPELGTASLEGNHILMATDGVTDPGHGDPGGEHRLLEALLQGMARDGDLERVIMDCCGPVFADDATALALAVRV